MKTSAILPPRVLPLLAVTALVSSAHANWTASGMFNYTDRTYGDSGFTGTAVLPVREADVEVYDTSTLAVLASGATNSSGAFSIAVTDSVTRNVAVRVLADSTQVASLNFKVVDDLNSDAVYSYTDAATAVSSHAPTTNVNFGTMTMPASIGTVATTDWSSQVFNTYDMCVRLADWIQNTDGSRPASACTVGWNPTQGRGGSFYSSGSNRFSLSDDDAYDDPNILHELGHFIEDEYGSSDNTGGTHFIGDNDQDPRLAWSEGFATFVSNATLDFAGLARPDVYQDRGSFDAVAGGFSYTLESAVTGGATNEQAVNAALYDLIDSASTADASVGSDDDSVSSLQSQVWDVVEQFRIDAPAATQFEVFWDTWRTLGLGSEAALQTVFALHSIDFVADAQEPNDRPENATALTVGGSYQENTFYRSGSTPAGDHDWFSFTATAGSYYRIQVSGTGGTVFGRPDPEMFLIDVNGKAVLAFNNDPYDEILNTQSNSGAQDMFETVPAILWRAASSGTFYVLLRHAAYDHNLGGRYGTYRVRVTTEASPTPAVYAVSAQPMLPGQSYPVAIRGANFSAGATVSTSAAGVTATSVKWVGPDMLQATLAVQGGTSDGSYQVTVANPSAGSGSLASAVTVSSSAQPPVIISEVELNSDAVEIKNIGTASATLTGWQVQGRTTSASPETFTFPTFTLAAGATVVISENFGTNTSTELFDLTAAFAWPWTNGNRGDAGLLDSAGRTVDFIRFSTRLVDTQQAPLGTGGIWMQPEFIAPPVGRTISRAADSYVLRSSIGLSGAKSTMPAGVSGRDNAVDAWEPNEGSGVVQLLAGTPSVSNLAISSRASGTDADWYGFVVKAGDPFTAQASFTHALGDLDMDLYTPFNTTTPLASSAGTSGLESIALSAAQTLTNGGGIYLLKVYGFSGATNTYSLNGFVPVTMSGFELE